MAKVGKTSAGMVPESVPSLKSKGMKAPKPSMSVPMEKDMSLGKGKAKKEMK